MRATIRAVIISLVSTLILIVLAGQASAAWSPVYSVNQVRFTPCNFGWVAGSTADTGLIASIVVSGMPFANYPNDGTASDTGAKQGFYGLVREAVSSWNAVMLEGIYGNKLGMKYEPYVSDQTKIRLLYGLRAEDQSDLSVNGITYIQRAGDTGAGKMRCLQRGTTGGANSNIVKVAIYFRVMGDWFTQYGDDRNGNSVRGVWESCFPYPGKQPDLAKYTCQKTMDFGSVLTHELGHAIGMMHPNPADIDPNNQLVPATVAKCGIPSDQSTMCRAIPQGRTTQRTIERPDLDAYHWGFAYRP